MDNQTETTTRTTSQGNNPTAATVDYVNYDYPQPSKRGRGYAPTGEFDLSLIREFRARPGFYDRNSPIFKDKLQTAHQWQEISNNLGYDVSLLKDRMLQLRNRYNLEKRRLEQLRDENPGQHINSPWPLFKHLHFLSEHIRPRRSYKSMQPRTSLADTGDDEDEQQQQQQQPPQHQQQQQQLEPMPQQPEQFHEQQLLRQQNMSTASGGRNDSLSDGGGAGNSNGDLSAFANGILTVKMEEPDADDANIADAESGSQSGDDTPRGGHPLKLSAASTLLSMQQRQPHSKLPFPKTTASSMAFHKRPTKYSATSTTMAPAIKIRRLDTMQERAMHLQPRPNIPQNNSFNNAKHNNENNNSKKNAERQKRAGTILAPRSAFNFQVNRRCLTNSEHKFAAFGEFVSSSLLELPATCALQLVEKFTSEVVRVLLDSKEKTPQEASGDGVAQPSEIQSMTPLPATPQLQQMNGGIGVGEAMNGV